MTCADVHAIKGKGLELTTLAEMAALFNHVRSCDDCQRAVHGNHLANQKVMSEEEKSRQWEQANAALDAMMADQEIEGSQVSTDATYICEGCGGLIPKERRRLLPGV